MTSNMNIWRHVLLFEWQEIQYFIYQNLLETKNIMCDKNINLTISAFLWKKMTVRKREKKTAYVCQHKICVFQYLICIQTYATYANCRTLLTGFTILWSNLFYNIVRIMRFFLLATYQFIHWLKLNFQQIDWLAVNFWL